LSAQNNPASPPPAMTMVLVGTRVGIVDSVAHHARARADKPERCRSSF
jgi:hypothetical protein